MREHYAEHDATDSLVNFHAQKKKVRNGGEEKKMAETKSKRDEISHLSSLNVNSIETVNDGVTSETIQPTPIFVCCVLLSVGFSARVGPFLLSWHIDRRRNESI